MPVLGCSLCTQTDVRGCCRGLVASLQLLQQLPVSPSSFQSAPAAPSQHQQLPVSPSSALPGSSLSSSAGKMWLRVRNAERLEQQEVTLRMFTPRCWSCVFCRLGFSTGMGLLDPRDPWIPALGILGFQPQGSLEFQPQGSLNSILGDPLDSILEVPLHSSPGVPTLVSSQKQQ